MATEQRKEYARKYAREWRRKNREHSNRYAKELRDKKKLNGLCRQCSSPEVALNHSYCERCLTMQRQRNKEKVRQGKCVGCGGIANGRWWCRDCQRKNYLRNQKPATQRRQKEGLCVRCGKQRNLTGLDEGRWRCGFCMDENREYNQRSRWYQGR